MGKSTDIPFASVPPHEPGAAAAAYTSPTIRLPDGTYIMDSLAIASKLEGLHPTPSLHLDSPYLQKLKSTMDKLNVALAGAYIPLVAPRLLNEASHPYWYKTREARFGMPLDRVAKTKGGDAAYQAAKPYLDEVTDMLKEDASGPYFMGQTVSYADFVWGGFLIFMKRIGEDIFSKVMEACHTKNVHEDLLKALEPLNARNDR